jgi:hypothetical protein
MLVSFSRARLRTGNRVVKVNDTPLCHTLVALVTSRRVGVPVDTSGLVSKYVYVYVYPARVEVNLSA